MSENKMKLWCDGACKGNPGPGGWGVFVEAGSDVLEYFGGEPLTTNNIMELTGMIHALKVVKEKNIPATIFVDSQYVKNGMLEWVVGWKKKGWKTAKGDPVKNKDLWVELDGLYSEVKSLVDIQWVKGHSGDPGNERADNLANQGCKPFLK